MKFLACLATVAAVALAAATEVVVPLPSGSGSIGLSTRGPSSFRVRFLFQPSDPIDTSMVSPDEADLPFQQTKSTSYGTGITAASLGTVAVSEAGVLTLLDGSGNVLSQTQPLGGSPDFCAGRAGDISSGDRVADPSTVSDAGACCAACKAVSACTNWIYGHPGDAEGNCWLVKNPQGVHSSSTRTIGGTGLGTVISFSTNHSSLFGRGASMGDATKLTATSVYPNVDNKATYVPHFYSNDGYAALGVVNVTTGQGKTNFFPANYDSSDGSFITWSPPQDTPFELYLMPAQTLDQGTKAYYSLIGKARIPPLYAFGFHASRWGWENRSYLESVLHTFRDGQYPIDSFITDFGWFTNVSDYNFQPSGEPWYNDFSFSEAVFPDAQNQLSQYRKMGFHMGGIRKPRLGNTDLINFASQQGWILPGGELAENENKLQYAEGRNINFSIPEARAWYLSKQAHYLSDGVDFFWNDEGETDYFTFYWWNVAQAATQKSVDASQRFYSINRAWSPGIAKLGAVTWTGDVNPSWGDLQATPGMVLNWGLAGAPYVACDIGGFTSQTQPDLLTRWYQVGVFMPIMRVHSTKTATPHFPWLWGEPYGSAMRSALNLRYQLIPYHYSLAHKMFQTGTLWMRPLVAEFPLDPKVSEMTSEWLDGDLLIAPVITQDSQTNTYLPAGNWFAFNSTKVFQGPLNLPQTQAAITDIPVFVRDNSIVALAPVVQYTDQLPGGPLEVQIYSSGSTKQAKTVKFTLTEDDGTTTAYETGAVRATILSWDQATSTLSWSVSGSSKVTGGFSQLHVNLFTPNSVIQSNTVTIGQKGSIVVI